MTSQPVYTAHDVADLFNLLPTLLGFVPEESICAIATSGPRRRFGFRLRIDVPTTDEHVGHAGRFVAGHLRNHGADGAIVLVVSRHVERAGAAARAVERHLGPVQPVVVAWTDGERYWTSDPADPVGGTVLDLSPHHPAVVSAVLAGQEVLPDRATLERRWAPARGGLAWLPGAVLEVERRVAAESVRLGRAEVGATGAREVLAVAEPDASTVRSDDGAVLRAGVWLTHAVVRERLWARHDRGSAERALAGWRDLARRSPGTYAAVPYAMAGYLAYLVGDGAQASIGLQHALAADPGYAMADQLAQALSSGLHPDALLTLVRRAMALASP